MYAGYEATFLLAVSSAYFLALNALIAYLLLQSVRVRDAVGGLSRRLEGLMDDVAQMDRLVGLLPLESEPTGGQNANGNGRLKSLRGA